MIDNLVAGVSTSGSPQRQNNVDRLIEIMKSRLGEELLVHEIIRSWGLNAGYFSRLFRRTTGMTPKQYLTHLRFEEAKRLLEASDLLILDVCTTVGFSSPGTFSDRFRKCFGASPTEYRQKSRRPKAVVAQVASTVQSQERP